MSLICHVLPHSFARVEVLGILVLARNAHEAHFYFLLKILDQPLLAGTIGHLWDEEAMGGLHMAQILAQARCFNRAEQTHFAIFSKNWVFFRLLRFTIGARLCHSKRTGVVVFGESVLIQCLDGGEFFPMVSFNVPTLIAAELRSLLRRRLYFFGFELLECGRSQLDHFALQVVSMEIGFVVLLVMLQVTKVYQARWASQL